MSRYVCIHGHFYQPPRENPWLEAVEMQDSAYPYHDWNARITAESYWPNAAARIFDTGGRIDKIVSNYSRMSFNFGPTLLAWMADNEPEAYQTILDADRQSRERFNGHGSALAQGYNHIIMPLAPLRDKLTQVRWGIRDFEHRFGRFPEGLWLPETAVDLETLEVLAQEGIRFTILAPHQARRVRSLVRDGNENGNGNGNGNGEGNGAGNGEREGDLENNGWRDVSGGRIDPTRPYLIQLPSGRSLILFFYDGPVSRAVAFDRLLQNGEVFARRVLGLFDPTSKHPQLAHIATDGETYGHHFHYGELALAHALQYVELYGNARLTNYGEYITLVSPEDEVEIFEDSSWSCVHSVERWRSDCGCNSGSHPGWRQLWRMPLREALDWLRDNLAVLCERIGAELYRDFWEARDDYISVMLDRSPRGVDAFLKRQANHPLDPGERIRALKLMEVQRHALLMYTSCGWFFDEISGIETVQVIQYAGRAIQLAQELCECSDLEPGFLERLAHAASNIPENGNGRQVYEKFVRPARVDLAKVVAHYALSSLFIPDSNESRIYSYVIRQEDYLRAELGRTRMAIGRVWVRSLITEEEGHFDFGVVHFGDQNLIGGACPVQEESRYQAMLQEARQAYDQTDLPQVLGIFNDYFGELTYSLRTLFKDEQRATLQLVLAPILLEAENTYNRLYQQYAPLMHFIIDLNTPLPSVFQPVPMVALDILLRREFKELADPERIANYLRDVRELRVPLDSSGLGYAFQATLEKRAAAFREFPKDLFRLEQLEMAVDVMLTLPFWVNVWRTQNIIYEVLQTVYPDMAKQAAGPGEAIEYPILPVETPLPILAREQATRASLEPTALSASLLIPGPESEEKGPLPSEDPIAAREQVRTWIERFVALGAKLGIRVPNSMKYMDATASANGEDPKAEKGDENGPVG